MGWKLTFHFEDFPKISMHGFVTALNENKAIIFYFANGLLIVVGLLMLLSAFMIVKKLRE